MPDPACPAKHHLLARVVASTVPRPWAQNHGNSFCEIRFMAYKRGMQRRLSRIAPEHRNPAPHGFAHDELPLNVRDAAAYLGVSPQTVYLWVERKQIPHLRVMGRNIRFLKSDLEPFRSTFRQEVGNGKT